MSSLRRQNFLLYTTRWTTIGDQKILLPPSRVERMHYSLGGVGLGHFSVGHIGRYTDLIGCVLVPIAVGRSEPWLASSSLRRLSPLALTLLGGARFIAWYLRCPFFRGMLTGPVTFLEPPGVSGLRLGALSHLKTLLCHTRPVGGTNDKYRPAKYYQCFCPIFSSYIFDIEQCNNYQPRFVYPIVQ